jgi:hypothetical protein
MATVTGTTLKAFAASLMPTWESLADWFAWPPDTFALTAAVFARTGCYRQVVAGEIPYDAEWQLTAEHAGKRWAKCVNERLACRASRIGEASGAEELELREPELVTELQAELGRLWDTVTMEQMRTLDDLHARELSEILIKLHGISDEACTGFGFPGFVPAHAPLAHFLGNLLLTSKGSLSSLPKHSGLVLPKMRTPQKGLTLRSLALHLTYHETEVEVMWRAMPWPSFEENTLNVLAVPWPPKVQSTSFQPEPDTLEPIRYFKYTPSDDAPKLQPEQIVEFIRSQHEEHGCRVHILTLPECALSEPEYRELLAALHTARTFGRICSVPLVIGGIRETRPATNSGSAREEELNQVRLSAYFAGRWYTLAQRKHHRWKLDRSQIRQYGLDGHLATRRDWYEAITLGQRRLTFLAPTGWLTLCPLICEDLAQLEPVSELIRGVGPTLLVALLADGPQLETRWSARYASVFADDPGTAVLTLTSLGMAVRSRRLDESSRKGASNESAGPVVALWRDLERGWRKVELEAAPVNGDAAPGSSESADAPAVLLTISADWQKEYTADGRHDHEFAATLKLEGVRPIRASPRKPADENEAAARAAAVDEKSIVWGQWADIRELSAAVFALDTIVALRGSDDMKFVLSWLIGNDGPESEVREPESPQLSDLVGQVRRAQNDPEQFGIAWRRGGKGTYAWATDLQKAANLLGKLLDRRNKRTDDFLQSLYDAAVADLEEMFAGWRPWNPWTDDIRIRLAVNLAALAAIYNNLEGRRRPYTMQHADNMNRLPARKTRNAAKLISDVEKALEKYSY